MDIPTEKFISALLFNPQLWIQETVENHDHPCPFIRTWHVKRESRTALAIHICKLFYTHSYIHVVVPFIKKWQTFPPSIPPSLFNFFFISVWSKMTTIRGWWHSKWWKRPICNLLQGQKVSPRFPHKLIARLWQICCRSNLVKKGKQKNKNKKRTKLKNCKLFFYIIQTSDFISDFITMLQMACSSCSCVDVKIVIKTTKMKMLICIMCGLQKLLHHGTQSNSCWNCSLLKLNWLNARLIQIVSYRKRKEIVQVKVTISLRGDPQQQSNDHIAVVTICGASLTTRHST